MDNEQLELKMLAMDWARITPRTVRYLGRTDQSARQRKKRKSDEQGSDEAEEQTEGMKQTQLKVKQTRVDATTHHRAERRHYL